MAILPTSNVVSVEPTLEPLALSEVKDHLRLSDNAFDAEIDRLLRAARRKVENDARRSLLTQTRVLKLSQWPAKYVELDFPPIQSVSSITYVDLAESSQTWSSSNYEVDTAREPGVVRLAYNATFPATRGHDDDIAITYVSGWTSAANVPGELKTAILLEVEQLFDGYRPERERSIEAILAGQIVRTYP